MIEYADFAKIDLRIGEIVEVKTHPNADKLYLLKVEIGSEMRQIVAGIKPYYESQELEGKYIAVVCNLEPRNIRGYESQGMLLAASSGEKTVLIGPYSDIDTGAEIK